MPDVGQLLGDRYRLADRVASGAMGDVWRAVDETLNRTVAVKMLHSRLVTDAGFGERFRREARAMASLHHPGVAEVYDYGETSQPEAPGLAYIVMEFVQGQPLSERIAEVGQLDTAETMSIAAQIGLALQAAHDAGVVHRDVKPSNLIIQPDGHVVLVDFGVAVTPEATSLTGANQVVGTALYMAPEQVSKNETTPAIDIYALGAVVYHCLAGRPPYQGDNAVAVALRHLTDEPPPLPEDVPAAARDLVATAMAKNPTRRFPTAAAMAAAAQALADSSDPQVTAALVAAAPTGAQAAVATAGQPGRRGAPGLATGRGRTTAAVVLASLAALAAVLVFADPTGLMPAPFGRPSVSPSATPPGGGSSPDAGGGEPAVSRSAGTGSRAPGSATSTAADPVPDVPPERPGPSNGSSGGAPRPTRSESNDEGPTAEPTAEPTVEPTADSTAEPPGESAARSTAGATAEPQVGPTPEATRQLGRT